MTADKSFEGNWTCWSLAPRNVQRPYSVVKSLKRNLTEACALVAAAYLENQISELLEKFFVEQGTKAKDALFDFNGPVGTFSSKIKMAYSLGLIPQEIQNALDLIRKLRNDFAHLHEPLDFESQSIRQRVIGLLPHIDTPSPNKSGSRLYQKFKAWQQQSILCISCKQAKHSRV